MLKLFYNTALRQLKKHRFHTGLNLLGLGLSIACCLFIYTYNSYQLSFDQFHPHADRTFMVVQDLHLDKTEHSKGGAYAMYEAIRQELPQVEKAAIYIDQQDFTLKIREQLFKTEGKAAFATSDYFELLHFPWVQGDPNQLNLPNTVALTQSFANSYFGEEDAMGQTIYVESQFPVKVVGIIDDRHQNSDFRSEIYFSLASLREFRQLTQEDGFFNNWGYTNTSNNILLSLHNPEDKETVEQALHDLVAKHWHKDVLQYYSYKLLGLTSFHFDSDYGKGNQKMLLTILGVIAFGILSMAVINYTNLVTAQHLIRRTELGIRHVLGSSKKELYVQFLVESLILSFFGVLLAFLLCWFLIDMANRSLFIQEPIQILSYDIFLWLAFALWLGISLISSFIQALLLRKTKLQLELKRQTTGTWSFWSKSLIVFQNTLAFVLITSTIVIVCQVSFLKNTDLGFDREMVVLFPLKKESILKKEQITAFLDQRSDVHAFTFCDNPPSNEKVWGGTIQFDNRAEWETWAPRYAIGDSSYLNTFGIDLIAGRNFHDDVEQPEYLINLKMAKTLGHEHPKELIGKPLMAGGLNDSHQGIIVGVVQDFNTNALHEPVSPTVIGFNPHRLKNLAVKLHGGNPNRLVSDLEAKWKTWFPNEVFDYTYYDDQIANLYQKESLLEKLIWVAAAIALFISSLGFLGLLSIMLVSRTKEIGIRKVLGSTPNGIFILLSRDFIKWLALAMLISIPIASFWMTRWLSDFAYPITLEAWMFGLTALVGISITLFTIGYQSLKAAMANPVKSLRDE
jgi:putative ABC transport system permease protein